LRFIEKVISEKVLRPLNSFYVRPATDSLESCSLSARQRVFSSEGHENHQMNPKVDSVVPVASTFAIVFVRLTGEHRSSGWRHHARPFEPYPKLVLGAVISFLEPFRGHLSPKVIKLFTN
jgi:hypothetical protein